MKAFCDGSGKAKESSFVVLAGVAAEESVWGRFESEWKRILEDRSPRAPYMHMNELIHGKKAFKDANGWDDTKRSKLFWDCLLYAQHLDKKRFHTFMCSVDMKCYREIRDALLPEYVDRFPSYVALCNKWVPMGAFKWYLEHFHNREDLELHYFFDQDEPFCGPFEALWKRKKRKTWGGLYNHWEIIKQVTPANMRDVPQLQLADVLAWLLHRHLTPHRPDLPWADFHRVTDGIFPFHRKEVGEGDLAWIAQWIDMPLMIKEYFETINPV